MGMMLCLLAWSAGARAAATATSDPTGLLSHGWDQIHRGDYPAAIATLSQIPDHGAYSQSLAEAYNVLYRWAKSQGDYGAALDFHEHYASAEIFYLNDRATRRLEIQSLSRKNSLLELEHTLAAKRVEATRLYGVILTLILIFIVLWAVLTKRSQLHFRSLSRMDGLTGISNRVHFLKQAEAALEYARKSQQDVCVVLFDLDHFKSINDQFGHASGDFVLKRTATLIAQYLRRSDLFGRFGGEEFSLLLAGCRIEEARAQAERLRRTIKGIQAEHRGATLTASASFGIASTSTSGYDLARLLANADSALYRAKRAGRDCVLAYDPADSGEVKAIKPSPQA